MKPTIYLRSGTRYWTTRNPDLSVWATTDPIEVITEEEWMKGTEAMADFLEKLWEKAS